MTDVLIFSVDREGNLKYPTDLGLRSDKINSLAERDGFTGETHYYDGTIWFAKDTGDPTGNHEIEVRGILVNTHSCETKVKVGEGALVNLGDRRYSIVHLPVLRGKERG